MMFKNGDAKIMAEIFTPSWVSCLDEGVNITTEQSLNMPWMDVCS